MTKRSTIFILIVALLTAALYSQRTAIITRLLQRGLDTRIATNLAEQLDDGLHLALCGAGGPMPAPQASGPCAAVVAGGKLFIVDSGSGGPRNLIRLGYQPGSIEAVFLTHFHSDHIDGLGELATLRWAGGDTQAPLPVYGPGGVERVVAGFNTAYAQDFSYRHAHHGDQVAPMKAAGLEARPFLEPVDGRLTLVFEDGDLRVEALKVHHQPVEPAVGYRFSYKDRSLLITGDTIKHANIVRFSKGVDLLVHEALAPNLVKLLGEAAARQGNGILAKVARDIPDYHASPREAAETARDAGAGHLLYYHITPPLVLPGQETLYLDGADTIFSDYTIGEDGVSISLPTGSDEIRVSKGRP